MSLGNGNQLGSCAETDMALLKSWHKLYMDENNGFVDEDSPVIRDLEQDELDHDQIEAQVQILMSTTIITQGFCMNCRHLFEHWPDSNTEKWKCAVGRSWCIDEIEAATRSGCKFCAFLFFRLTTAGYLEIFRKIKRRLKILDSDDTCSISIQDWEFSGWSQLLWLNFPGKVASHCNDPSASVTRFESHVLCPAANLWQEHTDPLDLAKMWLDTCSTSHERCRISTICERPSRLIAIGNDTAKLVETSAWETMPHYATLSYCWGHEPFITLTKDNMASLLETISLEHLPQTFQDAIRTARKLGLLYIWIDALCIVQDDRDNGDWLKEAGLMRSVYGGSHINLAASSAENVHQGFFLKPAYHNGGFVAQLTKSQECRVQNFHCSSVYERSATDTLLSGRAWAMQEKLLSPRTIYFGDQGLFWECRSDLRSEYLPQGFPGIICSKLVCPEDEELDWFTIVHHYSAADLTNDQDRLPALSGIARRQHEVTGDVYLAGMWRESLARQLPWYIVSPELKKKRPTWRAPTWSWASIDGAIYPQHCLEHQDTVNNIYVHVLDAWTEPSGSDPFGAVSGGEVSLACSKLVRARLCVYEEVENIRLEDQNWGSDGVLFGSETKPLPVSLDCLQDEFTSPGDMVYLLPLCEGPSGNSRTTIKCDETESKSDSDSSSEAEPDDREMVAELIIIGLVLRNTGEGHFCRVGSFRYRFVPCSPGCFSCSKEKYCRMMQFLDEEESVSTAKDMCGKIEENSEVPEAKYIIALH